MILGNRSESLEIVIRLLQSEESKKACLLLDALGKTFTAKLDYLPTLSNFKTD